MKVFTELEAWKSFRAELGTTPVGFVPTMGALHPGHESLVRRSLEENLCTLVSIFLNPTQFDAAGDLAQYPNDTDADLAMLETMGVDAVLMPHYQDIYPDGFCYRVAESGLSEQFCGAQRPGHFDGVLTVVMRLLNLVRPARAYFGEKDYQQLQLVSGMVEAFFMDTKIVACPTVREPDGLAMSSRNARLDGPARALAPRLYRSLRQSTSPERTRALLEEEGFEVDYVADLGERRLAAVRLGEVRLIDNIPLGGNADE